MLLDAQPRAGGQVWRHDIAHRAPRRARHALRRVAAVKRHFGIRVVDADASARMLRVEDALHAREFGWDRLILATGARELFLPFPGWTLPGVMGAGGLQALVKGGLSVSGKRIVVAGSGPLLLAVAAYLKGKGACVQMIAEQAPWQKLSAFALQLVRYPEHIRQAVQLGRSLLGVPI